MTSWKRPRRGWFRNGVADFIVRSWHYCPGIHYWLWCSGIPMNKQPFLLHSQLLLSNILQTVTVPIFSKRNVLRSCIVYNWGVFDVLFPISTQTDLDNSLFLESWHAPFPPKQIWKFTFSGILTRPIATKQIGAFIFKVFWNPDMSNVAPNCFRNSLFLESSVTHFHHIRYGNSLFLESGLVQFPPKRTWQFIFFEILTCPISPKTDLENHFFLDPVCPISITSDMEIHFFWNLDMHHFHQNGFGQSGTPQNSWQSWEIPSIEWRAAARGFTYVARAQLAMGGLGTSTQTVFSFGVLILIYFFIWGLVLADRSPPSPRVEFLSASSYCCVIYTYGCWVTRQSSHRSNRCTGSHSSIQDRRSRTGQTFLSLAGPVAHWDIEK